MTEELHLGTVPLALHSQNWDPQFSTQQAGIRLYSSSKTLELGIFKPLSSLKSSFAMIDVKDP